MKPDLNGQAILVTGAGRGLGRSTALHLAACGAVIGAADIDGATCRETVDLIRGAGGAGHAFVADLADRAALMSVAAAFAGAAGRLDAVVNNAMLIRYEPIDKVAEEVFDRMLAIGLKAPVWGVQALLQHMDPARGGAIVNLASPLGERGYPNTGVYSAIKGAIIALTRTLAAELGPRRVRVNAVAPGSVPTPGALALTAPEEYERRARTIPLRRLGHDDDNAAAIGYLLSREASFVTGEVLHVDGGIAAAAG